MTQWMIIVVSSVFAFNAMATMSVRYECPDYFHSVAIHNNAKFCQVFDSSTTGSLTYFLSVNPDEAASLFFKDSNFISAKVQSRVVITDPADNTRIIISPDKNGSQIAILRIWH